MWYKVCLLHTCHKLHVVQYVSHYGFYVKPWQAYLVLPCFGKYGASVICAPFSSYYIVLHCIYFTLCAGVYLLAVMMNIKVLLYKYSKKKQAQDYTWNLLVVNFCLLTHEAIWIMTTLAIEGGENYLFKVLKLGCVGLVVYDVCALLALINLRLAISCEPDSNCDDPSKAITLLQHCIPVFFLLSIARELHISSSFAVLLPVSFYIVGGTVIILKVYILHCYLAKPNFNSLMLYMSKGRMFKRITPGSAYIGAITIISLAVNLSQGYDSYRRWLSDESAAFRPFLAFYTGSYIALIGYEGDFIHALFHMYIWHFNISADSVISC